MSKLFFRGYDMFGWKTPVYNAMVLDDIYSDFEILFNKNKDYNYVKNCHKKILKDYEYFKNKFNFNEDCKLKIEKNYNVSNETYWSSITIIIQMLYDKKNINLQPKPLDVSNHTRIEITMLCLLLCDEFCIEFGKVFFAKTLFETFSMKQLLQPIYPNSSNITIDNINLDLSYYSDINFQMKMKYSYYIQLMCDKNKCRYYHVENFWKNQWNESMIKNYSIEIGYPNIKNLYFDIDIIDDMISIINSNEKLKQEYKNINFVEFNDVIYKMRNIVKYIYADDEDTDDEDDEDDKINKKEMIFDNTKINKKEMILVLSKINTSVLQELIDDIGNV